MVKEDEEELRLPGEGELLGIVIQLLGYDRARVRCEDMQVRICRIPGRFRKRVWIKEGDYVLIAPWDFQPDKRGDIIHRYERDEIKKLDELGYLDKLKGLEEI